jgi:hypothetical protein
MTRAESRRTAALIKAKFGRRASIISRRNFDLSVTIHFGKNDAMVFDLDTSQSILLASILDSA